MLRISFKKILSTSNANVNKFETWRYRLFNVIWFVCIAYILGTQATVLPLRIERLTQNVIQILTQNGRTDFSAPIGYLFIGTYLTIEIFFAFSYLFIATLLFWQRRQARTAAYVAITFVAIGLGQIPTNSILEISRVNGVPQITSVRQVIFDGLDAFAVFAALVTFYIMPNGRFVPRWTRWAAIAWGIVTISWLFIPTLPFNAVVGATWDTAPIPSMAVFLSVIATGVYSQMYRWRRASNPIEREQIKWILLGMLIITASGFLRYIITPPGKTPILIQLVRDIITCFLAIGFPICISIAVRRHNLWRLTHIINLTIVWGLLSALVVSIFVLVVRIAGDWVNMPESPVLSAVATAVVALMFQPARQRIQNWVDYRLFGTRDRGKLFDEIRRRYENGQSPKEVLNEILESAKSLLRLPSLAVEVFEEEQTRIVAQIGEHVAEPFRLNLVHQSKILGHLLVSPRGPGDGFSLADLRMLELLSSQSALLVHILYLNEDLQSLNADLLRSREELAQAAESERQRLQRDLHDGLISSLSAQILKLGTALASVHQAPDRTERLLTDIEQEMKTAIADARRLIHGLRPMVLDQVGLLRSLQILVEDYQKADFHLLLHAPEQIPDLLPATEAAIYHIIREAVQNVVKHAQAKSCQIHLYIDTAIHLIIQDDGSGFSEDATEGRGLRNLRQRAEVIGGKFSFHTEPGSGTRVEVELPLITYKS